VGTLVGGRAMPLPDVPKRRTGLLLPMALGAPNLDLGETVGGDGEVVAFLKK